MNTVNLRMLAAACGIGLCSVGIVVGMEAKPKLADAVKRQDKATVRLLLENGADVTIPQADGMTALHWAVYHDDLQLTKELLERDANAKAANRYGVTVLSIACLNGNGKIVELLLKQGADADQALRGGETPLMIAARTGKLEAVNVLLSHGVKVDVTERHGQTALMWAAAEGNVMVVDALLKAGADFKTPLPSGFTPLFFAVREGRGQVVRRLLQEGLNVNDVMQPKRRPRNGPLPGTSPLILAIENGHFELAAQLVDRGANPNTKQAGFAPLHAMTWVRKPLRGDGDPPPIGSGKLSSLDLVRVLVEAGADVDSRHPRQNAGRGRLNRTEATPFLLAAETGDVPLMKLLVELGADPLLQNKDHCTPLLAAAGVGVISDGDETAGTEEEAIAAIEFLLEQGADINAVDDLGNSAMHGAAYKSWTKLVQFLADHGADPDIWNKKNKLGWTPLMIANGHRPGNFRPSAETIAAIESVLGTDP